MVGEGPEEMNQAIRRFGKLFAFVALNEI